MQRELWTRTDLRNALTATYVATALAASAPADAEQAAFMQGFKTALMSLALNFGLPSLALPTADPRRFFAQTNERSGDADEDVTWSA